MCMTYFILSVFFPWIFYLFLKSNSPFICIVSFFLACKELAEHSGCHHRLLPQVHPEAYSLPPIGLLHPTSRNF